jgi:hypothetical protein
MTIVIPKLVSLDIIDLNKRLRDRYKQPKQNLLDILPDDVMKIIIKHKISYDFDDEYDWDFVKSKYNSLYKSSSIYDIVEDIINEKKWKFIFNDPMPYDDANWSFRHNYAMLDFVKNKMIENETTNFDYLKHFKRYLKKEVLSREFEIGKTYHKSFKNKNTKETINIPYVIIERERNHIIANVINTDVNFRSHIDKDYITKKEDDNNIYLKEYFKLDLEQNKEFAKYLKDNNLSVRSYMYKFDS